MTTTIKGAVSSIEVPYGMYNITPHFLSIYENFNQKVFDGIVTTLPEFKFFVDAVYDIHKQNRPKYVFTYDWMIDNNMRLVYNNKDVLLGFSGGWTRVISRFF